MKRKLKIIRYKIITKKINYLVRRLKKGEISPKMYNLELTRIVEFNF